MSLVNKVLVKLDKLEWLYRLENDGVYTYLSIIDQSQYPRIFSDSIINDDFTIIAKTDDYDNVPLKKDWIVKFVGESIDEVLYKGYEWICDEEENGRLFDKSLK